MAVLFSIVAVPFYVPTSSAQRFQFHILVNTCYFLFFLFDSSYLNGCEVAFYYGFNVHFPYN